MQTISDMVIPGEAAADVGTDHGYIPAYLLTKEICPRVILTDIADGPLQRAEDLFERNDIAAEFRLGAGIEVLDPGEVSTVIIAGMGGETIMDILGKDLKKSHSYKRLILQPRTFIGELRVWLSENGFRFTDYALCRERKLINEVMAVETGDSGEPENILFSRFLLDKGDPLLCEYLDRMIAIKENVIKQLGNSKEENGEMIERFKKEKEYLESIKK